MVKDDPQALPDDVRYVLDGGALLHRVSWRKGHTYKEIINTYIQYVMRHYGTASVVFDGYKHPSTKDQAHLHRRKDSCATVNFEEDMTAFSAKGFLNNGENKTRFIAMLTTALQEAGCDVTCARNIFVLPMRACARALSKERRHL